MNCGSLKTNIFIHFLVFSLFTLVESSHDSLAIKIDIKKKNSRQSHARAKGWIMSKGKGNNLLTHKTDYCKIEEKSRGHTVM